MMTEQPASGIPVPPNADELNHLVIQLKIGLTVTLEVANADEFEAWFTEWRELGSHAPPLFVVLPNGTKYTAASDVIATIHRVTAGILAAAKTEQEQSDRANALQLRSAPGGRR